MKKQSSIDNKIELNRDQRRRAQKPSQTVCHLAHSDSKASTISCSTAHRPRRLGCLHPTAGHPDDGEACYFWLLLPRHEGCQKKSTMLQWKTWNKKSNIGQRHCPLFVLSHPTTRSATSPGDFLDRCASGGGFCWTRPASCHRCETDQIRWYINIYRLGTVLSVPQHPHNRIK